MQLSKSKRNSDTTDVNGIERRPKYGQAIERRRRSYAAPPLLYQQFRDHIPQGSPQQQPVGRQHRRRSSLLSGLNGQWTSIETIKRLAVKTRRIEGEAQSAYANGNL